MADGVGCPAVGDAGDRVSQRHIARRIQGLVGRIPSGPARIRGGGSHARAGPPCTECQHRKRLRRSLRKTDPIASGWSAIGSDAFFTARSEQLAALAFRYAVPTVYENRRFVEAGGLVAYSGAIADAYRLAGVYVARILKGEKPGELPVQQATKVEMFLNLKTAKALGITVPLPLLGRADEVIELGAASSSRCSAALRHGRFAVRAQQGERLRRIGVLAGGALASDADTRERKCLRSHRALQQLGWIEGRNVQIDYRYGLGQGRQGSLNTPRNWSASQPDVLVVSGASALAPLLH